jgi:ABC-2 type transport system ATP-binding protein
MNIGLNAQHLIKRYPGAQVDAVNDLTLTIPQGEIFGFLGPNGAGKSTAVQLFATTLFPTSGSVSVAGYDTMKEAKNVRQSIGVVFQNTSLDLNLTVEENLRFHAVLHGLTHPALTFSQTSKKYQERALEILEVFGLSDRQNSIVKTLSGGLKRRVDIAKALLHIPELLFLDEPTTGLDPQSRRAVWQYLKTLHAKRHFTLFLTTQYLEEAEICDRIGIIDQGKIVVLDTPKALKASIGQQYLLLETEKPQVLLKELVKLKLKYERDESGAFFIPLQDHSSQDVLRKLQTPLSKILMKEPSLDDVFLHYTGKSIEAQA